MKVRQLLSKAFNVVGFDDTEQIGLSLVKETLNDMSAKSFWRFLPTTTTYQAEIGVSSVGFDEAKFPSAAITTFSKNLIITSSDGPLRKLDKTDRETVETLLAYGATGFPEMFALFGSTPTLIFYPIPASGFLPLLTLIFEAKIAEPTSLNDDLETKMLIPERYHELLIPDILRQVMAIQGDPREQGYKEEWNQNIINMKADDEGR